MITILYVDDDPNLLEMSKEFLEGLGDFKVQTALSARIGLEMLEHNRYDAIISDYQMDVMDGIGFLKVVRGIHNDIPFILFTGKGREEVVIDAINNGADFYLQKGGNPQAQFAELVHKVTQSVNRRMTERALKSKKDELDNLFSLSLDLLCIADVRGHFIRVNNAWGKILGYDAKDLEGRSFLDFVHPEDIQATLGAISELEKGKNVIGFVNRYRSWEGDYRWIEWRSAPYEGKFIYAAATDITERKLAEDQLKEAYERIAANEEKLHMQFEELAQNQSNLKEANQLLMKKEMMLRHQLDQINRVHRDLETSTQNFRCLVENAPETIFIADMDLLFTYINKAGVNLFGASDPSELLGTLTLDRIHPRFHPLVRKRVKSITIDRMPVETLEEVYVRLDGSYVNVEVNAVPINYNGEDQTLVIVRDIEKRKQADEALLRSEQMLKLVLDNFPGVVYWKDRNSVYIGANRESARIAGFSDSSEYAGKTDFDLPWGKTEAEAYRADDRQVIDSGQAKLHVIEKQLRAGGEIGWLDTSKVPLRDLDGNVIGVLGFSTDITERIKAQEELLQANLVIENSPAILFRWKASGEWSIELVSKNVEQFGYSAEELLSDRISYAQLVHPDDLERLKKEVEEQVSTGIDHFKHTYRILGKDGTVHWVDHRTTLDKDAYGKATHFQGIVLDITDRVMAENALLRKNEELNKAYEALRKVEEELRHNFQMLSKKEQELESSERRYRRLLEQSFDAIITHQDGKIILSNEAAARVMGAKSTNELIGRPEMDFEGPKSRNIIEERIERLYNNPGIVVPILPEKFITLDGRVIDVEVMATSYLEQGKPTVQVVFRDVTDRNRIQSELEESNEKYHELFEVGGEAIFLINNEDGKLLECNTAASEMYGYSHEELLQMHNTDLSAEPEDTRRITSEGGDGSVMVPIRYHHRKDGIKFPVEINGRFFSWKGKDVHVAAIRDISERMRIDNALRQTNKKLNLLNSITRHDILNKILVLQGNLEMARMMSSDPSMASYIDRLDKATRAIKEHIEFTRIYQDLGMKEPVWQPLKKIIGDLEMPQGMTLVSNVDDVEVYADPMLAKVFYNLLDNTVRHGMKTTKVSISMQESVDGLTIIWQDDGIGIPVSEKEKIFEHGYGKNTGLGLFISREILAITQITIREKGMEGEGARFELHIPFNDFRKVGSTDRSSR